MATELKPELDIHRSWELEAGEVRGQAAVGLKVALC